MKITDLVFESNSCCGTCFAATVALENGETLGVVPCNNGLYNLSFYNPKGLLRRESGQTVERVESLLPG